MEKITITKTGEIKIIENPNKRSGYKMVTVPVEIKGKKAEITIEEQYKYNPSPDSKAAKMVSWQFVTGDAEVDKLIKVQTDFSAYALLDIEVDIDDLLTEVENLFDAEKEKEKTKKLELAKLERAAAYDKNYFLRVLKPELEELGHNAVASCTKEEAVENGRDVGLIVNGRIRVGRDYKGNVQADNSEYGNDRVEKSTRSAKTEKIIETVKWVIEVDESRRAQKADKLKKLAGAKEKLGKILGIDVVEKKEYHSTYGGRGGRSNGGYESSYFVDAKYKENYSDGIRFEEGSEQIKDGKEYITVKGFRIKNLPLITDEVKLKKIYELLTK